jgi:hypothetical protein
MKDVQTTLKREHPDVIARGGFRYVGLVGLSYDMPIEIPKNGSAINAE